MTILLSMFNLILILSAVWIFVGVFGIFVYYKMEFPEMQKQMRQMWLDYLFCGVVLGVLVWYAIFTEEIENG